jgi:hypothetical protein
MTTTRQSAEAPVGWTLAEDGAAAWDSGVRWSYFVAERPGGRIGLCGLEPVRPTSASACLYLPGRFTTPRRVAIAAGSVGVLALVVAVRIPPRTALWRFGRSETIDRPPAEPEPERLVS